MNNLQHIFRNFERMQLKVLSLIFLLCGLYSQSNAQLQLPLSGGTVHPIVAANSQNNKLYTISLIDGTNLEEVYEICVYDGAGNISNPQEVCVTVESWGGSSKIVGEWNLFEEVDIFGGESDTTLVGEEDCSGVEEIECNNENTFMTDYYCYLTHNSSLTFNADGTFEYTSSDSSKEIKLFESKESCEAIYDEVERSELSKGNWAYVQDTNDLILIMYSDVYTRNGETETENYEPGEGAIFAEIGIFLIDDVIRIGPGEESSENGYYRK